MARGVGLAVLLAAAGAVARAPQGPATQTHSAAADGPIRFEDATAGSGLDFVPRCGDADKDLILEANGTGLALFDADGDGRLDLFLPGGGSLESGRWRPQQGRLYLGRGGLKFEDATARSGIAQRVWGSGVALGDVDGDGDQDLLLTGFGNDQLFRNDGGGRFTDVSEAAGVADPRWGMGAAFGDLDLDGDLDLYVANYLEFDAANPPLNTAHGGKLLCQWQGCDVHCGPLGLTPAPDALYLNDGQGRFSEVSAARGTRVAQPAFGMGVVIADFDRDGDPDIYVANDVTPNFLFRNRGDGRFEEVGVEAGVAFGDQGQSQSSMGIAVGDADGDGFDELHVTNFSAESNAYYRTRDGAFYEEYGYIAGIADISLQRLGWGTFFFDADNDGWQDLFVANGHVYPEADRCDPRTSYRQAGLLFRNLEGRKFAALGAGAGATLQAPRASRGAAFGDFDDDGDLDIALANIDEPPTLLANRLAAGSSWAKLELRGGRRSAFGALVTLEAGGRKQVRELIACSSYMSCHDTRMHFGLGAADAIESLEIRWPGGAATRLTDLPARRLLVIDPERGLLESRVLGAAADPEPENTGAAEPATL
ncbi:MAG TPA: CRTAC1 family protein [Acidobacteriota bacterium]